MFSDRGTNFIAVNSILTKELRKINEEAEVTLRKKGIEWTFNPPHAPHRGGVWERVVGMFKRHLKCTLSGEIVQLETFTTIIVEIEGILNGRPLTAVSTDSRDVEALTPNHILAPASMRVPVHPNIEAKEDGTKGVKDAWKRAESAVNSFWKHWKADYLSLLHQRQKWRKSEENLKEGDLVILVEEGVRRKEWKLGRVSKTLQTDAHVRRVEIKRGDGKVVIRDRTKLVKLEMDNGK
jgi:hypothetical protein